MSEKKIHIVFEVLNFLHSNASKSYHLFQSEKLILINLASHMGQKGIFPAIDTIAEELSLDRKTVIKSLNSLAQKKIISVNKSAGLVNQYFIQKLSTTSTTHATGGMSGTSTTEWDYTSTTHATPPVPLSGTRYNKVNNKRNNREERARGKTRAFPLSDFFQPHENLKAVAQKLGINYELNLRKFICDAKATGKKFVDADAAFEKWLLGERNYATPMVTPLPLTSKEIEEVKVEIVCAQCNNSENYCRCRYVTKDEARKRLASIIAPLKGKILNGGGHD